MKNSDDLIGNQTRDLPAFSSMHQLTALLLKPPHHKDALHYIRHIISGCRLNWDGSVRKLSRTNEERKVMLHYVMGMQLHKVAICLPLHVGRCVVVSQLQLTVQLRHHRQFLLCMFLHTGWSKTFCSPDDYNTESYMEKHASFLSKYVYLTQSDCLEADRQGQGDIRLTLTPSVIPNSNYVIMVSDWNFVKDFCVFLYCNYLVHRDFLSPCIFIRKAVTDKTLNDFKWPSFGLCWGHHKTFSLFRVYKRKPNSSINFREVIPVTMLSQNLLKNCIFFSNVLNNARS
jgi:hypothetical protein